MPSPRHDALVTMLTEQPQAVVDILRNLMGVALPDTPFIRQEDATFNTRYSVDIEADAVLVMGPPQSPLHAIIVEIQQDASKDPRQFARYAASLWLMLRCDVTVLVICPDRATAAHYAQPIATGLTGYRLQAHVLGPDDIPAITNPPDAAAHLPLAAMSLMVHGRNRKVVEAFATALNDSRDEHAPKYYEYAYSMAGPETRRLMEEIMASTTWPVYSPFAREHFGRGLEEGRVEGRVEGRAEGEAKEAARMVLLVLSTRGLDVPDDLKDRITACTDRDQLEAWAARAVTAETVHDLFAAPGE